MSGGQQILFGLGIWVVVAAVVAVWVGLAIRRADREAERARRAALYHAHHDRRGGAR